MSVSSTKASTLKKTMILSDKKILHKVINGQSSANNAERVVDWFSSTIEGQHALSDLIDQDAYLMEEQPNEELAITPFQSSKVYDEIERTIKRKKLKRVSWRVAAVMIPFLFLLGGGLYIHRYLDLNAPITYIEKHVAKGSKMHIVFQDGSEAILNADTKIKYPSKFKLSKREVFIDGEGYFKVATNKHKPFIVNTADARITVLGTSFNVAAYSSSESVAVTLDEGSIVFNTKESEYKLNPSQQLIFNTRNKEQVIKNLNNSTNNSLWVENILYLKDTPLKQVIEKLERRFDVDFSILDSEALTYSYTITTSAKTLEEILVELEKIAPVRFTLREGIFEISIL